MFLACVFNCTLSVWLEFWEAGWRKFVPPGFEPGTFRVLGERDNHYTTETLCKGLWYFYYINV